MARLSSSTVVKFLKHNDSYFKIFNGFHEGNRVVSLFVRTLTRVAGIDDCSRLQLTSRFSSDFNKFQQPQLFIFQRKVQHSVGNTVAEPDVELLPNHQWKTPGTLCQYLQNNAAR